ncbi:isochorismatase domain-containing protein 1 isoform X4 [Rhineura floridana]|uniref:isochorismatase domain-containing protein 1 isoform X4 n=1 Tax=Rhineura floridana TaxID=261503 RepID=UPI002AC7E966|nr:isochorismatase domain-containing protein 1 isoform X4 [Rhineura floridana]
MVRRRSRSRDWGPPAPPAWPVGGNASSSRRSCSNSSGGAEPERLPPNMAAAEQQQQQHFTEAVVAPPLASGGREATCGSAGSSPGSVPVLFCFSVFARPSTVPHGSGYEVLIQKFLSLYGDQLDMHRKFVVQLFSEEWSQYIDLPKGFLVSDRCKVRLVPLQIQTHPQGHKGKIPSHPQCSRFGGGDEISQLTPEEQRPGSPPSPAKHTGVRITTLGNLTPSSTVFFCCDMQERFRPAIKYFGDIISVSQRLTHVCIQQTALELVGRGLEVHIVADATSSRSMMDRMFALERLARTGIIVTTSEAILLQLIADKEHPKFKEIQNLIKASAPESGLLSKV